ncbi:MAG: NADH dehydrogenase [Planctomycetota bacterium]|jgi:NADH dehydrogenase
MSTSLPHVVVVGGGFAGLMAVRSLRRAPVRVTLVDRRNHHLFQPLLYQVATAALNPGDIAYPIRSVLRSQKNARTLLGRVCGIDTENNSLKLRDGDIDYDYLLLATGASHSYFGKDEWETWAPGLKTIEDALEIRRRVLSAFEAAERIGDSDPKKLRETLTFVIVGAGPTGVELAGALAEIGRLTVAKDFRSFDPRSLRVVLVEAASRVLPPFLESLSEKAKQQLEQLGVEVRLNSLVTHIDEHGVQLGEEHLAARTVLWGAGVAASPLGASLGAETDRAGRVKVAPDLRVAGLDNVFVAGDLMHLEYKGKMVPGVAPAAIQAGRAVARNIQALVAGRETKPFRYLDKGSLATIGRAKAVGSIGRMEFSGWFAWWVWWMIHIAYLVGYRNRIAVMMGWAWQYFAFSRGARLITGRWWAGAAESADMGAAGSSQEPADPRPEPSLVGPPDSQ